MYTLPKLWQNFALQKDVLSIVRVEMHEAQLTKSHFKTKLLSVGQCGEST